MAPCVQPGKDILNNILSGGLIAHDQNREAEQLSVVTPEQLGQLSCGRLPALTSAGHHACAISDQHGRRQLPMGKPWQACRASVASVPVWHPGWLIEFGHTWCTTGDGLGCRSEPALL